MALCALTSQDPLVATSEYSGGTRSLDVRPWVNGGLARQMVFEVECSYLGPLQVLVNPLYYILHCGGRFWMGTFLFGVIEEENILRGRWHLPASKPHLQLLSTSWLWSESEHEWQWSAQARKRELNLGNYTKQTWIYNCEQDGLITTLPALNQEATLRRKGHCPLPGSTRRGFP